MLRLVDDLGEHVAGRAVEAAVLGQCLRAGHVDPGASCVVAVVEDGDALPEGGLDEACRAHGIRRRVLVTVAGACLGGGEQDRVDDVDHAVVGLDVGRDDGGAVDLEGAVGDAEGELLAVHRLGRSGAQGSAGGDRFLCRPMRIAP